MFNNIEFSNFNLDKTLVDKVLIVCKFCIVIVVALFLAKITDIFIHDALLNNMEGLTMSRFVKSSYTAQTKQGSFVKYAYVLKNNVFDADTKLPKRDFSEQSMGNMTRTNLDIELIGTIVLSDPKRSVAAIKVKNSVDPYVVGDVIEDTAKIVSISDKRVVFNILASGKLEYLDMDEDASNRPVAKGGIRKIDDEHIIIDKGELNRALNNLNQLLLQARAVPYMEDGEVVGFKLLGIKKNSLYDKLGAKNGDIIKSVNGIAVDSPTVAMQLYHQLRTGKEFNIEIDRRGEIKDINIQIR